MKTLDRYLMRELAAPFLFGVVAFVSLFAAGDFLLDLTDLMAKHGLGMGTAALLFLYWLPRYLVLTFPMSMLLAVLLSYGRLSGESEITAMRAGGLPFPRLVLPAVAAGLAVSLLTIAFNEELTPSATRAYRNLEGHIVGRLAPYQHFSTRLIQDDRLDSLIYARTFDPAHGVLGEVTYVKAIAGKPAAVVVAEYARWDEKEGRWYFYNGVSQLVISSVGGNTKWQPSVEFRKLKLDLGRSPREIERLELKPENMTWGQLRQHIAQMKRQRLETAGLETRWHHKLSIPFASLIFALIGAPLGLRSHRGSSSFGLGLSILIAFCYYVLWQYMATVAEKGIIAPLLAAWLPNLVGLAAGLALIRRAAR